MRGGERHLVDLSGLKCKPVNLSEVDHPALDDCIRKRGFDPVTYYASVDGSGNTIALQLEDVNTGEILGWSVFVHDPCAHFVSIETVASAIPDLNNLRKLARSAFTMGIVMAKSVQAKQLGMASDRPEPWMRMVPEFSYKATVLAVEV